MQRASRLVTDDDRKQISESVATAERRTTAEIVPIVATDAGRYDRAEDLGGLLIGLGAFIGTWLVFQREDPAAGGWDGLPLTLQLPVLVGIILVGFVAGALMTARVAWLRRLLTPRRELREEADARAAQLFHDQRIHHTDASTGVMLIVFLFERRAVILADEVAHAKLGSDAIDALRDDLTGALRRASVVEAMSKTIRSLGDRLAEVLPRDDAAADLNELPNALVTLD